MKSCSKRHLLICQTSTLYFYGFINKVHGYINNSADCPSVVQYRCAYFCFMLNDIWNDGICTYPKIIFLESIGRQEVFHLQVTLSLRRIGHRQNKMKVSPGQPIQLLASVLQQSSTENIEWHRRSFTSRTSKNTPKKGQVTEQTNTKRPKKIAETWELPAAQKAT